jgi:hypothetical protein
MTPFFRIKNYLINLDRLAYVRVEENFIDFGFSFPVDKSCGEHFIRLEKGANLQDAEFEQIKEFVLQLPDPDRVIVI